VTLYSVYSYDRRQYDYYEAPSIGGTHAGAPPKAPARHATGATPEGGTWRLPFGAKKVGTGDMPKGRIAATGIHLGGLGDLAADLPRVAVIAGVAILAWRYWR